MVVTLIDNHSSQLNKLDNNEYLLTAEWGLDKETQCTLKEIWGATSSVYSGGSKTNFFLVIDLFFNRELRNKLKDIQDRIKQGDKHIVEFINSGL